MAAIHRQTLVQLIAAQYTTSQIADCLNVTTEAVQAALDTDTTIVSDAAQIKQYEKIDSNYNKIEERASTRLASLVATVTDPMQLLKITTGINNMRRRSQFENAALQDPEARKSVVKLSLPKRVPVQYEVSNNREVTSVDGRQLISMPAQQLLRQEQPKVEERRNARPHLPKELTAEDIKELL